MSAADAGTARRTVGGHSTKRSSFFALGGRNFTWERSGRTSRRWDVGGLLFVAACLVVPVVWFCLLLAWGDVYPFGAQSFLTEDLKYQYIDFFAWFRRVLEGNASLMYTNALSLGLNAWGIYSYYLGSPLNLLIVFFDEGHLVDFIFYITCLKLALIQLSSAMYLRRRFKLRRSWAFLLGLCFSFCTWTVTDLRNPLWLDCLYALPLAMLGCWRLVRQGKCALLVSSVTYAVICCWYMGYMSVLFLSIYVVFEAYLAQPDFPESNLRFYGGRALQFAGGLILALLLAAWTFVPTVFSMLGSTATTGSNSHLYALIAVLACVICVGGCGLVLWLLDHAGKHDQRNGKGRRGRHLRKACVFGLVALVVVVLMRIAPTISTIVASKGGLEATFSLLELCSVSDVIAGFFRGTYLVDEMPQLFCATLPVLLLMVYLIDPAFELRERVSAALFILLLLLSVWLQPLEYVWCGFRFPNGFYCRMAFTIPLFLLFTGGAELRSLAEMRGGLRVSRVLVPVAVLGTSATFVLIKGLYANSYDYLLSLASIAVDGISLLIVFGGARSGNRESIAGRHFDGTNVIECNGGRGSLTKGNVAISSLKHNVELTGRNGGSHVDIPVSYTHDSRHVHIAFVTGFILLAVVTTGELVCGAHADIRQLYNGYLQSYHDQYVADAVMQNDQLKAEDSTFWRADKKYARAGAAALDEGMAIGYASLSSYCSSYDLTAINFLNALGYSDPGQFSTNYVTPIQMMDSLLGMRYVYAIAQPTNYVTTDVIQATNGASVYENPLALSLGYTTNEAVLSLQSTDSGHNPFEYQNAVVSAILGRDASLYYAQPTELIYDDGSMRTWVIDVTQGQLCYAYVWGGTDGETCTSIDGNAFLDNRRFRHAATELGGPGKHTVSIANTLDRLAGVDDGSKLEMSETCYFYSIDIDVLEDVVYEIGQHQFVPSVYEDGYVSGSYTADADGLLLLSIPWDSGWDVAVNGQAVNPQKAVEGALMAIEVKRGANAIEMTYRSPGLRLGITLTFVTAIGLAAYVPVKAKRRKHG